MGRSDARRVWTSYETATTTNQLANTQFGMQWQWGGEVHFGRRFCCGCVPYAIEATYWTTEPFSGCQVTTNPGGYVSTPLGDPADVVRPAHAAEDWFDGAKEHRVWRRDEFHNIEINLIREQLACALRLALGRRLVGGPAILPLPGRLDVRLAAGRLRLGRRRRSGRGLSQRQHHQQSVRRPVRLRRRL